MNEASRLLDGDLTAAEMTTLLERLKHDADLRDELAAQQLILAGLAGLSMPDDGYSLRMLARLRRFQMRRS